jgi:hypothetical protein
VDTVKGSAKAIVAFLYGAGAWIAASIPDLQSFGDLTAGQWLSAFLAGLVGGGLVYAVPNKEPV